MELVTLALQIETPKQSYYESYRFLIFRLGLPKCLSITLKATLFVYSTCGLLVNAEVLPVDVIGKMFLFLEEERG